VPRLKKVYASSRSAIPSPAIWSALSLTASLTNDAARPREAEVVGAAIVAATASPSQAADAAFYVRPALVEIGGQTGPVGTRDFCGRSSMSSNTATSMR